jgi:hypothetical protein
MTPTLRRLNDRERYWGLTWPGWFAAVGAGGVLYGAVKLSPFGLKPTVTIVLLLLGFGAMVVLGVSGQALSPSRHLHAILDYRRSPKRWELTAQPDKRGLVLANAPDVYDVDEGHTDSDATCDVEWFGGWLEDERSAGVDGGL